MNIPIIVLGFFPTILFYKKGVIVENCKAVYTPTTLMQVFSRVFPFPLSLPFY